MENLEKIYQKAKESIEAALNQEELENLRIQFLGKKGLITSQSKTISSLPDAERKSFGAYVNEIRTYVTEQIERKSKIFQEKLLAIRLEQEKIDITIPARLENEGYIHQITHVIEEITSIFLAQGFEVEEGPEIEDDFHNFTALNISENHPARQMHDTFYLNSIDQSEKLLRTHTSSVQVRIMKEGGNPPFKFIAPGRVYRKDYDMTHTPMFHQLEGIYIDKNINMGHLKGCLYEFLKEFFCMDEFPLRFRPSFFPFTEPSAEVDIGCSHENSDITIGSGDGWLEILGCGMVHPNVLKNVGIDPEIYQGFAFGLGVERLAMLKYGIADLRSFFESDLRWLKNYNFTIDQLYKNIRR